MAEGEPGHEREAAPSAWPVYLVVALTAIWSLFPQTSYDPTTGLPGLLLGTGRILGLVAAVGIGRMRPWGWHCAFAWVYLFSVIEGVPLLMFSWLELWGPAPSGGSVLAALCGPAWLVSTGVIVWVLVTRRRLFFPDGQHPES